MTFKIEDLLFDHGPLIYGVIFYAPIFLFIYKNDVVLALVSVAIGHFILLIMTISLVYYKKCIYPKEFVEMKNLLMEIQAYVALVKDVTCITIKDVNLLSQNIGESVKTFLNMPTFSLSVFESLQMISISLFSSYALPTVSSFIGLIDSIRLFFIRQKGSSISTFLILILFCLFPFTVPFLSFLQ